MYDRLSEFFPNENDDIPTFEDKLASLKKHINSKLEVADIRSKYGIDYNLGDRTEETTEQTLEP